MIKSLEYYFENGTHVKFSKYTIDTSGVVRNKKSGKILSTSKIGTYNVYGVCDDYGKRRSVRAARAIASTFIEPPPTLTHTADHINRESYSDNLDNIRWLCKSGQQHNRDMPGTKKNAFIIAKDGEEKTAKEWVDYLKDEKNPFGREYTRNTVVQYAQKKQHGFSYKEYPDFPEEVWKKIGDSKTTHGRWEISNMNRVKYITKHAENVLSGERLGIDKGYPTVYINGKHQPCHILSFMTFFPEEYSTKKVEDIILHEDDDKLDFRPHKLRIGTRSENMIDAHNNGCHDGKRSERSKCASYIDGVFEKEHVSQKEAVAYLKSIGYDKASKSSICDATDIFNDKNIKRYGRTWKLI